ncbi:MaoC family dehydratase N-terminal domain-containing protein [Streptomyces sp. NPDC026672]|uniref:FAS1-like dehydratase domain-containing protein n=1 Tax=unclassified Streptomyces TaxID=2593676 RepID=UPI0033EA64B1
MAGPESAGRTAAPFRLDVEHGKIREFARATQSRNPDYQREDAPIPATFLTTQYFWSEGDASYWRLFDFDWERGLHAEQEYVFHGPPPTAGTRLTGRSTVREVYEKQGRRGGAMTFVVVVTEFRDDNGRLVAEDRATLVETGRPPAAQEPEKPEKPEKPEEKDVHTS